MNSEYQVWQPFWRQFLVLRKEGLEEEEALRELASLMFLKMLWEQREQEFELPPEVDWPGLLSRAVHAQVNFYRDMFRALANAGDPRIAEVYAAHPMRLRDNRQLAGLLSALNNLDWPALKQYGLGAVFEALLEHYAPRSEQGWELTTPLQLANSLISLLQPRPNEIILDPALGAGTLLVTADAYRRVVWEDQASEESPSLFGGLLGVAVSPEQRRLARINLTLHESRNVALYPRGLPADLPAADVFCGNLLAGSVREMTEPFSGGTARLPDPGHQAELLRAGLGALKTGGRAAVIVSDELLYQDHENLRGLRAELLNSCRLHTVLRLPPGALHGREISANVLFFTRGGPTETLWVYDMRTGLPCFDGKHLIFEHYYLQPFEIAYGGEPTGLGPRRDSGEGGRFRPFTREELAEEDDNLDIFWLDMVPDPVERIKLLEPEFRRWMGRELQHIKDLLHFP